MIPRIVGGSLLGIALITLATAATWRDDAQNQTAFKKARAERFETPAERAMFRDVEGNPIVPTLIGGTPIKPGTWKPVVYIRMNGAACTATIVGPKVVATAAHCIQTGEKATFTLDGKTYSGTGTRHPKYPGTDIDNALIKLTEAIPVSVTPIPLAKTGVAVGEDVHLLGGGCINIGGGGGNDGVIREGRNRVTGFTGNDIVSGKAPGGAALCYGDSGGPTLKITDPLNPELVASNSKGNIKDTNYSARWDSTVVADWVKSYVTAQAVEICGVNKDCGPGSPPPPGKFAISGKQADVEVVVKDKFNPDFIKKVFGDAQMYLDSLVQTP